MTHRTRLAVAIVFALVLSACGWELWPGDEVAADCQAGEVAEAFTPGDESGALTCRNADGSFTLNGSGRCNGSTMDSIPGGLRCRPTTTTTATTIPPTTTTTVPPSVSGQPMPVGNLTGWTQVFVDDFLETVPLGQWPGTAKIDDWGAYGRGYTPAQNGWDDTSDRGWYRPEQVMSEHDGVLDYFIHTDTATGRPMVSAPWPRVYPDVSTTDKANGVAYGRFSVRMKSDPLPGYKVAWLLWPDERYEGTHLDNGELDWPESNLVCADFVKGFVHRIGATVGTDQDAYTSSAHPCDWHTYTIEWSPGQVRYLLDGTAIGTSTARTPVDPMHWVLQTETQIGGAAPAPSVQGHVVVDWAVAYAYTP